MFERVLVAVDGSHTSELALQEAITLCRELNSQLRVVHVVDQITLSWPEGGDLRAVTEALQQAGQRVLEKAEGVLRQAGMVAELKLLEIETVGHRIAEVIATEAATWPADLIVIGSHGRRGVSRLFIGSVAEGLTRVSRTPLLIIRGK